MLKSVSEAAAHLDRVKSDWYQKVDTDLLQMTSTRFCILGQVYGEYSDGLEAIGIDFNGDNYEERALFCDHGNKWKEEINVRVAGAIGVDTYLLIKPDGTVVFKGTGEDKVDIAAEALNNAGVEFSTYKLVK